MSLTDFNNSIQIRQTSTVSISPRLSQALRNHFDVHHWSDFCFLWGLGQHSPGGLPRGTSELIKHQTLQRGFEAQRYFVLLTLKHWAKNVELGQLLMNSLRNPIRRFDDVIKSTSRNVIWQSHYTDKGSCYTGPTIGGCLFHSRPIIKMQSWRKLQISINLEGNAQLTIVGCTDVLLQAYWHDLSTWKKNI